MPQFSVSPDVPDGMLLEDFMEEAYTYATALLTNTECRGCFIANVSPPNYPPKSYDDAMNEMYTIDVAARVDELNMPVGSANGSLIKLNPILMLRMFEEFNPNPAQPYEHLVPEHSRKKRKTGKASFQSSAEEPVLEVHQYPVFTPEIRRKAATMFIGVKLAREVWRLTYRRYLQSCGLSKEKGVVREDMIGGELQNVMYYHIGDVIEHDVLGGLWGFTSYNQKVFMNLDAIVLYPSIIHTDCNSGSFLHPEETEITESKISITLLKHKHTRIASSNFC